MDKKPATFVLVHGAWWAGDWLWRGVTDRLRADGHRVYAPVLTGLGPREHLAGIGVTLSTHILDVTTLIKREELNDIVLVGHSYGGMVISGVAENVAEGTIRSIVYLDAFLPEDGESIASIASNFKDLAGDLDPVPPPLFFAGENRALRAVLEKGGTPHPRACFEEAAALSGARAGARQNLCARRSRRCVQTFPRQGQRRSVLAQGDDRLRPHDDARGA